MPDIVLSTGDIAVNKIDTSVLSFNGRKDNNKKKLVKYGCSIVVSALK